MNRKIFTLIPLILITVILFTGCNNIDIGSNIIRGTGEMISRTFEVDDFTGLNIGGSGIITFRQSQEISVNIEMQENLFEYLEIGVQDNTLSIGFKSGIGIEFGKPENRKRIYINAPSLEIINFSGAVSAKEWDVISAQSFSIMASGAGDINIPLEVESLHISSSGAVDIELSGNADNANISVSDAGNISALNLQTKDTTITVTGAGGAEIAVSDNLHAVISGVGSIKYKGDPAVTQNISGVGTLTKIN